MHSENTLRFCPVCRRARLRHKLGTNKYYCPDCRLFFFKTGTGIYARYNRKNGSVVNVEELKREIDTEPFVNDKVVQRVFKDVVDKNNG